MKSECDHFSGNFHCIYVSINPENMWEWILRMGENGGRNIKLDQAEVIDTGSLSRDSALNVLQGVRKGSKSLAG